MASKYKILMSKFKAMNKNTEPSKEYVKNVGKSAANVGVDLHNDYGAPITKAVEFKDTIKESFAEDRSSQIKKIKGNIINSQEVKLGRMYAKSVKEAISTGKVYLSEDERFETEMKIMMGDFGDDDESQEQPLSSDTGSATGSFEAQAQLESASTNALVSTAIANTADIRGDIKILTATTKAQNVATVNAINNLGNFNETVMKSYIERTITWQDSLLKMVTEQRDLMQKGMFNDNLKFEAEAETQKTVTDRLLSGDFKGALKQVATGTISSMDQYGLGNFKQMLPMLLSGAIANPLGFVTDKIKEKTGLGTLMESNAIGKKVNAAGFKLSNMSAEESGVLGFLGEHIGKSILAGNAKAVSGEVDTSKYEKGKVQWDGMARKTLVDVIPYYLRKMTAALTGGKEQLFDYNSGKFTTAEKLKAKIEQQAPTFSLDNELYTMIDKYIDKSSNLYEQASSLYDEPYKEILQNATKDILTWLSANRLPLVVITQTSTTKLHQQGLASVDELTMLLIKQALNNMNTKGESIKEVEANMKRINKIDKATNKKHKEVSEFNKSIRGRVRDGGAYTALFDGTNKEHELSDGIMNFKIKGNDKINSSRLYDAMQSGAYTMAEDADKERTSRKFSDDTVGHAGKSIIASNVERVLYGKPLNDVKPEDVPKIKERLMKRKDSIKDLLNKIPNIDPTKVDDYVDNALANLQAFISNNKYRNAEDRNLIGGSTRGVMASSTKGTIVPGLELGKGNPNIKTDISKGFVSQYDPSFKNNSLNINFSKVGCGIAVALSALYKLGKAVDSEQEMKNAKSFVSPKGVSFDYFRSMATNNKLGYAERNATLPIADLLSHLDKGGVAIHLIDQAKTKENHYVLVHGYTNQKGIVQLVFDDPARGNGKVSDASILLSNSLKIALLSKNVGLMDSAMGLIGGIKNKVSNFLGTKTGSVIKRGVNLLFGGAVSAESKKLKFPSFIKPKDKFKLHKVDNYKSMDSNTLIHLHLDNITKLLSGINISNNNSPSLIRSALSILNPLSLLSGGSGFNLRGGISKLKNLGLDGKRGLSSGGSSLMKMLQNGKGKLSDTFQNGKGKLSDIFQNGKDTLGGILGNINNPFSGIASTGRNMLKKLNPMERFRNRNEKTKTKLDLTKTKLDLTKAKIELKIEKTKLKKLEQEHPSVMSGLFSKVTDFGSSAMRKGGSILRNSALSGQRMLGGLGGSASGLMGKLRTGNGLNIGTGVNKVEVINPVQLGGGYIDAVGAIRAIDQDIWATAMKESASRINKGIMKSKLKIPKLKTKSLGSGPVVQDINKRQDGAYSEQQKQTSLLEKIGKGEGVDGEGKEKKGGIMGMVGSIAKMIPILLPLILPFLGASLFTDKGKDVAKDGMGMVNKVTGMGDGGEDASITQTRNNAFRNFGKLGMRAFNKKSIAKTTAKTVATGASSGIIKKGATAATKAIVNGLTKLLSSKAVTKMLGPNIINTLQSSVTKIAELMGKKAKTGATKSLFSRFRSVTSFIPMIGQVTEGVFLTMDLIRGWRNANNYFGINDEDTTVKMKSVSALVSALQGLFSKGLLMFISLLPAKWLVNIFYKFVGTDEEKKLIDDGSKKAEAEYKAYVDANKDSNKKLMSKDQFLDSKDKTKTLGNNTSTKHDQGATEKLVDNVNTINNNNDNNNGGINAPSNDATNVTDATTGVTSGLSEQARLMVTADLRRHEGFRSKMYYDTVGIPTIGYGMNLKVLPKAQRERYIRDGITREEGEEYLKNKVPKVWNQILKRMPWADKLDDVRKGILINMGFNMGVPGISKWKNFLGNVKAGDYEKAANIMEGTKWRRQVHGRAVELIDKMRNSPRGVQRQSNTIDISRMTAHANGGVFTKPHMAIIGDAPETIIPHKKTAESIALWKEAGKKLGQVNPDSVGRDESGIVGSNNQLNATKKQDGLMKQMLQETKKQTALMMKMVELLTTNNQFSGKIAEVSTSQINKIANFSKLIDGGKSNNVTINTVQPVNNGNSRDSGYNFEGDAWFKNIEKVATGTTK